MDQNQLLTAVIGLIGGLIGGGLSGSIIVSRRVKRNSSSLSGGSVGKVRQKAGKKSKQIGGSKFGN